MYNSIIITPGPCLPKQHRYFQRTGFSVVQDKIVQKMLRDNIRRLTGPEECSTRMRVQWQHNNRDINLILCSIKTLNWKRPCHECLDCCQLTMGANGCRFSMLYRLHEASGEEAPRQSNAASGERSHVHLDSSSACGLPQMTDGWLRARGVEDGDTWRYEFAQGRCGTVPNANRAMSQP